MRILVLHSDIAADAPPEEQDTLVAARAVADALEARGHQAALAAFAPDPAVLQALLARHAPDLVFNLVESLFGAGLYAALAPAMLARLGQRFTGATAAHLLATTDKPFAKTVLHAAGLPTPAWSVPPFANLDPAKRWIVKAADEDASIGLDDEAVVPAPRVAARAADCAARFGGRWFAEEYIEGREFNIALLQERAGPRILPMAEMRFADWPPGKPRLVGYEAKWAENSRDYRTTLRRFGLERAEPALAARIAELCRGTWDAFGLSGYARIDFRVTEAGAPLILEINPNPGIAPDAGFAAAAAEAGMTYDDAIERIVDAALP